jgi:hypothetical protein
MLRIHERFDTTVVAVHAGYMGSEWLDPVLGLWFLVYWSQKNQKRQRKNRSDWYTGQWNIGNKWQNKMFLTTR